ncbi:PIR Superfamily Protein [Plasmodium ovale curtisi]|uniref:PIR Superfamily Protein n=1 Tax=Plasmodium ovale curtisi TaxID=864141 RepID=A0A1A8X5W5_PLAOA|nr:PIR Superfamily Protein [Plasmodium ovale curtisi]
MACTEEPKKGDYGFFEKFDYYNKKAESAEMTNKVEISIAPDDSCPEDEEMGCYYFLINDTSPKIQSAHIICEQFKKIYNILLNSQFEKEAGKLENNDYSFMNYWLNDKLRGNNTDLPMCVKEFYKTLKEINDNYFKITTLDDKLYNIKRHDLENMRNLYDLYNIKDKISGAIANENSLEEGSSCLWYTKECYAKYRDAIINCLDGCFDFYNALTDFRNKLKEFSYYTDTSISCKYKELFELPDYETVLKEHKSGSFKRIITLPLLFPLLGMCFMFIFSDTLTPFRQKAFEKIKSTKNMLFGARERSNELLSYTSDNDNIIGDHEEYSIGYYSVGNY